MVLLFLSWIPRLDPSEKAVCFASPARIQGYFAGRIWPSVSTIMAQLGPKCMISMKMRWESCCTRSAQRLADTANTSFPFLVCKLTSMWGSLLGFTLENENAERVGSESATSITVNSVETTNISLTSNPKRMALFLKEHSAVQLTVPYATTLSSWVRFY